jgi:membrane associated rhomboid family serine protease
MSEIRLNSYSLLPPVVKNLLIINAIIYLATLVFRTRGIDLVGILGLHYISAQDFKIWQPLTYMFMHGGFGHLFFNMFALWMFGATLENSWGGKRFLLYYLVCGIGAGLIQLLVIGLQIHFLSQNLPPEVIQMVYQDGQQILNEGKNYAIDEMRSLNLAINSTTVGASGSVFGLLLAFGMMYPNSVIYIYFLLPIKAKWFVIFYGALELVLGVSGANDGIAHFAHLGGMLFGFFLILHWNKGNRFFRFKMPTFNRKRNYKYTISSNYQYERPLSDEEYNYQKKQKEEKTNRILDKISKSGYESLTQEEKDFLFSQKR